MMDENTAIKTYFSLGLSQADMLYCLAKNHRIILSKRTLKRRLKSLKLFRRKHLSDILDVACTIEELLEEHSCLRGYRLLHLQLQQKGLVVGRQTIRDLQSILDPEGIENRKRKRLRRRQYINDGPNFLWHVDGNDKIKPFGIAIHGCIDGFSRYVIWLKACSTNNDPKIIGGFYWSAVKQHGVPARIRSDKGTENVVMEDMQKFIRRNHLDQFKGDQSFIYGSSQHNQRIECWWGFLRRSTTQFYMDVFQEMKDNDYFDGGFLDKNLIRFCFMDIIQKTLDETMMLWNSHLIAASRNAIAPNGRPVLMYFNPELFGGRDCTFQYSFDDLDVCKEECTFTNDRLSLCDKTVYDLCSLIMHEHNLHKTDHVTNRKELYLFLRRELLSLL